MALIECPECKKQISDQAAHCPHCGYSSEKPLTESTLKRMKVKISASILMFIGTAGWIYVKNLNAPANPDLLFNFEKTTQNIMTFSIIFIVIGIIIYYRATKTAQPKEHTTEHP